MMAPFREAYEVLAQAVEQRVFPGAAFGILHGGQGETGAVGRFTYDAESPAMLPETLFDVASLTKVMATTALAMRMWQGGELNLDMPLAELLPGFAGNDQRRAQVTLGMLLSHTSGLPGHLRLYELASVKGAITARAAAEEAFRICLELPLQSVPGERAEYSDIGIILLGEALRGLHGSGGFNEWAARDIFSPLGMASTGFLPAALAHAQTAPTCDWRWRHHCLQGEVQDENCALLGGVAGHAGVFSTVPDVLRFAEAILRPGSFFDPRTVEKFSRRIAGSRALGWDTPSQPSQSGRFFSVRSIGHLGYTGTSLWIDLERGIAITLLTNRVYTGPDAPPLADRYAIQRVRPAFHDAVMQALLP
jgi:CubicO group peptidase (beta-lactamase class C family)